MATGSSRPLLYIIVAYSFAETKIFSARSNNQLVRASIEFDGTLTDLMRTRIPLNRKLIELVRALIELYRELIEK